MEQYTNNLENLVREQTGKLEEEQQMVEQILLELLPKQRKFSLKNFFIKTSQNRIIIFYI